MPNTSLAETRLELTLSQTVEQVRSSNLFVEAESYAVAGAMAGGWLSRFIPFFGDVTGFNFGSMATAVLGAVLLLWLYRKMKS